jgi:hypothetical protein
VLPAGFSSRTPFFRSAGLHAVPQQRNGHERDWLLSLGLVRGLPSNARRRPRCHTIKWFWDIWKKLAGAFNLAPTAVEGMLEGYTKTWLAGISGKMASLIG